MEEPKAASYRADAHDATNEEAEARKALLISDMVSEGRLVANGLAAPRYPVFIVGSPRSGTSILVDALLTVGYRGFREGNFLSLLFNINREIDNHYSIFSDGNEKVMTNRISKDIFKGKIFRCFYDVVSEHNSMPPWFDKTGNPEMISCIPILRSLWPDAIFIFAKRRAIENVTSRLKKFPAHSFEHHCIDWARNMATWRSVRSQLPAAAFIEIDQQQIIQCPDEAALSLNAFLSVDTSKNDDLIKVFQINRPQQTADGSAARVISLESTGWSDQQKSVFLQHCKAEMEAFGYSMGNDYSGSNEPLKPSESVRRDGDLDGD
jgi:hypothetical protein